MDTNKSIDDGFLTIKEFSELVVITKDALRHYDRIGLLHPDGLGEKGKYKNEYRYYAPTQITAAKMIRVLAEIGVMLQTIKEHSESRTPEKLMKLLHKQKRIVEDEIYFLQEVCSVISTFLNQLTWIFTTKIDA